MTTIVTIKAHCGSEREVCVAVVDETRTDHVQEAQILQDGETAVRYAYSERGVVVFEREKL